MFMSFLMAFAMGLLVVELFWPTCNYSPQELLLRACLSVGIGFGVSSLSFFVWLIIWSAGTSRFPYVALEGGLLILLALPIFLRALTKSKACHQIAEVVTSLKKTDIKWNPYVLFLALLLIGLVIAVISFILISIRQPHGEWDAWAIWNMHARFLFKGTSPWIDIFKNLNPRLHPDYPLLLPASIARCWKYVGTDATVVPAAVSMCFAFATLGMMASSLFLLRGKVQGLIGALFLLGTSSFVISAASQYADTPLAFYFCASVILFYFYKRFSPPNRGFLVLSGMTAGCAAWTKNEGMIFVFVLIFARGVVAFLHRKPKEYIGELFLLMIGALPTILILSYFKFYLAPPNADIQIPHDLSLVWGMIANPLRLYIIISAFFSEITHFGGFAFIGVIPLLGVYLFLSGVSIKERNNEVPLTSFLTILFMFMIYFLIFCISANDLSWQLATSLNRFFLQMWPTMLFSALMYAELLDKDIKKVNNPRPTKKHKNKK